MPRPPPTVQAGDDLPRRRHEVPPREPRARARTTLGVTDFGENRHQDAQAKAVELSDLGATLAFRRTAAEQQGESGSRICERHAFDRQGQRSSRRWRRTGRIRLDCFIQLNLTDDPKRGGVDDAGRWKRSSNACSSAEGLAAHRA
jgi:uncharacterized pyridoxal phosphate-containing UPF0001 family protein